MAAVVGSIGMLLIPIALIMFVIGLFKKSPNLKSKALKCFGLGLVLFIVGGIFHDSTPKDKNETNLQVTNQVTKQEEKKEVKQEPKQEDKVETPNITSQPVVESDVKKREATPITNEILEKYKENIAMQFKLKKDEYVDLLTKLDEFVDLKRYEVRDQNGYLWHYVNSLPDEIPFNYIVYYELNEDQKTGQIVLQQLSIKPSSDDHNGIRLYERNGKNNIKTNINNLFITKKDIEKFRTVLQSKYSGVKELKGVDPKKIQPVGEYFAVKVFQDQKESYAVFGYMHVVRYDKEYYGGSDKCYCKIMTTFDSRNRYSPNRIISAEESVDPNLKREKDIKQLFEKDEKIDIPNQPYALFQFYSVDNDWRFVKDPK